MKNLLFLLFITFALSIQAQSDQGPVKIKFFNKSGYTIDSLYYQNSFIGTLKKDSCLDFIFKANVASSSLIFGKIGGMKTEKIRFYCGTGIRTFSDTTIYLDIKLKYLGKEKYQLATTYHQ